MYGSKTDKCGQPHPHNTTYIYIYKYLDVPLERADLFEVVPLLLREARSRSLTRVEPPRNVNNKRDVIKHLSVPQYGRGACAQLESKVVGHTRVQH